MSKCNHLFVDGFGMMGDAWTCCLCGYSKYPEAIPLITKVKAEIQGRVIKEGHPEYKEHVKKVQEWYRDHKNQD